MKRTRRWTLNVPAGDAGDQRVASGAFCAIVAFVKNVLPTLEQAVAGGLA